MSKYTYRENIYNFDGDAIGYQEYTIPNSIVEQIISDAIEEAIIEILKLDYGVMTKDDLFYKVCDLLVKLKEQKE